MNYLRLVRWPNLLMLILGMYMLRLMLVEPLLILSREAPVLTSLDFLYLVVSTIFIAAGGFIINDIEDKATDAVNKPEKVLINRSIPEERAWNIYLLLTFVGICIGFYLTFWRKINYVAYINLIAAGLLYFYSTTYKGIVLVGNIMISLLTSLSLAVVYLTEPAAPTIAPLKLLVSGYLFFSFLISMAREILKDLEDIEGDKQSGLTTLPVLAGQKISKALALLFLLILMAALVFIQISSHQWEALISFLYVVILIQIPLTLLLVSVVISTSNNDYHRCSVIAKFIMLTGVLSLPVFYYSYH